jgi:hypothetical protein
MVVSSTSPFTASPGFHVRRLQVRFKMRDAFPLLDHDDRIRRGGLETDASGVIHQRRIAVAALFLQNGRNNFCELIQNRLAMVLARTSTNFCDHCQHG